MSYHTFKNKFLNLFKKIKVKDDKIETEPLYSKKYTYEYKVSDWKKIEKNDIYLEFEQDPYSVLKEDIIFKYKRLPY
jgi:hypothetical protein